MDNDDNAVTYALKSGDMIFSNNNWLIHGRTSFEDFEDEGFKRTLFRAWITGAIFIASGRVPNTERTLI